MFFQLNRYVLLNRKVMSFQIEKLYFFKLNSFIFFKLKSDVFLNLKLMFFQFKFFLVIETHYLVHTSMLYMSKHGLSPTRIGVI